MISQWREALFQSPLRVHVSSTEPKQEQQHNESKNGPLYDDGSRRIPPVARAIIDDDKTIV